MATVLRRRDFVAGNHGPKIVPTGANHLRDMNYEKSEVAQCQPKMLPASPGVSAKQACQPRQLCRLVNGQTREQRAGAHQNHARVGELLGGVEFSLRRLDFAEVQVVQNDHPCFAKTSSIRQQVPPLARNKRIRHVANSVDRQEPHDREMPRHALGQPVIQVKRVIEPVGKKVE